MFCNMCGAACNDGSKFCSKCGEAVGNDTVTQQAAPAKPPVAEPSSKRQHTLAGSFARRFERFWDSHRVLSYVITAVVLMSFVVLIASMGDHRSEAEKSAAERTAITAIQQRYKQSVRLQLLNPDWESADWSAFEGPIECTYGHPERKNCWKVIYRITVMPNAESRRIECDWLVNADTKQYEALNTEARTMFDGF